MKEKQFLVAILLTFILIINACGGGGNVLNVGTSAGFRPFEYREGGEIVGFDIDLINEIAKKMGKTVRIHDMEFDALIEAVRTGTVDIIAAGMTITDERKTRVDFSIPYFTADQSILVRNDSDISINSIADADKSQYRIGVQNDTTGAIWADENITNASINKYGKYIECIQDLENRNIHMVIMDKSPADAYAQNRPVKVAYVIETNEQYGLAVKKGSDLLPKVNKALQEIQNSDKWVALHQKYFD